MENFPDCNLLMLKLDDDDDDDDDELALCYGLPTKGF